MNGWKMVLGMSAQRVELAFSEEGLQANTTFGHVSGKRLRAAIARSTATGGDLCLQSLY